MDQYATYFEANRQGWNQRTEVHKTSSFYDLESWKKGRNSLTAIELRELGAVAGKRLLHLQCHFGQDTLSLARMGAEVTGCDLSDRAIETARELAAELGLPAEFVCCNVYDLPQHLAGTFDLVYTSFGTIGWLPDLERWAAVIDHFLKPGGHFYLADFHPVVWMFDDQFQKFQYSYFNREVIATENSGTYGDREAAIAFTDYGWNHPTSEVLNSLLGRGLQLEFFNEYPYSPFDCFANTVQGDDGYYRIRGLEDLLPMVFSLRCRKG